jgi:hypothetical protein
MTVKRKPSKEFSARYSAAKRFRSEVEPDIREVLRFTAPPRVNDFGATGNLTNAETDTFISIGEEMATDLAGDLVNYFMPSEARWGEYEVTTPVPEEFAKQVEALVNAREQELFDILDASNLNDIKPQIMFEAATHGTPAIWVNQGHIQEPIFFEVVPPNELLIAPGHLGILDRFRETHVLADHLEQLLPGMDLSHPSIQKKREKPGLMAKVCWGYWLDWSDPGNPMWAREILVDDHRVSEEKEIIGPMAGACPLLVGRFNPQPRRAWGRGPGIKALPDLLTLNKIEEVVIEKLDEQLDPAWTYVDDGVLNMSGGIQAGMAYPRRSPEMPAPLAAPSNLDYGFFTRDGMEERVRVAFYQDGPRQRGDTPPTASQWLDERRRVQSRLGKPSAPLWTEMIIPLIQRTEYLAVQMGMLPDAITLNGQSINIKAISPLQRSQNQDKAMVSRSNLELGIGVFGEAFPQLVDMVATFQNHINATGDELTVIRQQPVEPPQDETQAPPA